MTAPRISDEDLLRHVPIPAAVRGAAALRGSAIQCDHTERMLGIVLWIGLGVVLLLVSA